MSQSSGNASGNGQFGDMRKKITQVATKALRDAAKSSKAIAGSSLKSSKSVTSKRSGK